MESRLTPYQAVPLIECTAALAFAPHPDDETLGCGGLLAACHAAGIPTHAVIVTSGDFGEHGKVGSAAREAETSAAAAVLGIDSVQFWREPDRGVACNERTIAAARKAILDTNADLILAPSFHEIHPDHRATAWIVIEATRRLAEEGRHLRLAMYEVGAPLHRVDVLVDITAHEAAKRAAVAKYVSQLSIQPYDAVIFSLNHYRTYTLPASVKYAEAFCILDAETLKEPERIVEAELLRQERLGLVTVEMPEDLSSSRSGSVGGTRADAATSIDQDARESGARVLPLWQGPKPLVSVLCRSTNRAELPEALRSIALQSYPNIEVVLVDALGNGLSLSNSDGLQAPVKLVSTGSKLDRPRAANAALDNAAGDYLIFLDEDDWFDNDHIERLLMTLMRNKGAEVAYSNTRKANPDGTPINEVFDFDFDPLLLKRDNYIPIHSALFSRKLLDAGCRFDESLPVYEDWDFWLQCAQHTVFIHVPVISAHYRMGGQSATALASENLKYVADSAIFNARAKLFQKWLHKWSGQDLNTVLGTMDKSRDLNKLSREISAKNTHIDELTQQIHIAKESIATLENRLGELVQEVHDLNHARDLLAEELHQQRLTLEYRIRSLETEQQILLGSLSWRITKPLREGKKFLSERVLSPIRKMFHK